MLITVALVPDVVTEADAVMFVAPAELISAAFKMIEATPPLVNAVAEAGLNATRELSAANVTTVFVDTSAPLLSLTVAVTVTGVPNVTELELTLNVIELKSIVVGVVPVPAALSGPVPQP